MIFDVNVYYSKYSRYHIDVDGLIRDLRKRGITHLLITPIDCYFYKEYEEIYSNFINNIKDKQNIFATIVVDPKYPGIIELIEELIKVDLFKAFRFTPGFHNFSLNDRNFEEILGFAEERNIPIFFQYRLNWGEKIGFNLSDLAEMAKKHRNLKIVVTNLNYGETLDIVRYVKDRKNILLETSFYHPFKGIEFLVKILGIKRILFGSAYPVIYPECSLLKIKYSSLSIDDRKKIFFKNAEKLLLNKY